MKKRIPKSYDFIVIGGGSGGYTAAAEAVKLGLRTALVEGAEQLSGLCILRGCMPSKTLIASANRFHAVRQAQQFGIGLVGQPNFHPQTVIARKRRLVEIFAKARREEIFQGGFTLVRGHARFIDENTVAISSKNGGPEPQLSGKTFLISTGSYIPKAEFPGLAKIGYLTSDDILENIKIPASLIILGDGPVGLEAAHYYATIGSKVTLVGKSRQVLHSADADVAEALEHALTKLGVRIIHEAEIVSAEQIQEKKAVKVKVKERSKTLTAEEIVFAIGRKPCVQGLGLESAGVGLNDTGHVETNEQQRTHRQHIFAAGDVCGPFEILHLAVQQGRLAARNAARHLGKLDSPVESMDYRMKLSAIFTEPQVAVLGLTEKEARKKKTPIRVARYYFKEEGRAQVEAETQGFAKLICEPKSGKLLGAAIVGPSGAELIHEMVAVLKYGGTAEEIAALPHYHPTLSEIWTFPAEKLAK